MPERPRGTGSPGPVPARLIETANLKTVASAHREVEGGIDLIVHRDGQHLLDGFGAKNPLSVDSAPQTNCRIEARHIGRRRNETGARNDHAINGSRMHGFENLDPPIVRAIGRVQLDATTFQISRKHDEGVLELQGIEDLLLQIDLIRPPIQQAHELGDDPMLRQEVVRADASRRIVGRHLLDGGKHLLPVRPPGGRERLRGAGKTSAMGEDMAHQHGFFSAFPECGPNIGDPVIEPDAARFDLLPEGDGRQRLGAGKERKERVRLDEGRRLRVGIARHEIDDRAAVVVDRQRRTGIEPLLVDLRAHHGFERFACSRVDCWR